MFEIVLREDYEDHYMFREQEKAGIDARNHQTFMQYMNKKQRPDSRKKKVNTNKFKIDLTKPNSTSRDNWESEKKNKSVFLQSQLYAHEQEKSLLQVSQSYRGAADTSAKFKS